MVPFRVNAGYTSRALFCSVSGGGIRKVEKSKVVNFPAPDRSLLKVITVIDGVEVNDRDAVLRNKLLWIVDCLKTRFPQRKMVGVKKAEKILYAEQYSREDLDRAARLIQKVRSWGGAYAMYMDTLYGAWDDAASVSDSAADIGLTGEQWSRVMFEMQKIKKLNSEHSEVVKGQLFKIHSSRHDREKIIDTHKQTILQCKSLLSRLLTLSGNDLNADVNADVDDTLEGWDVGKRLSRRLRKAYYICLAKEFLKGFTGDPLDVFGEEATNHLLGIKSVSWSNITRFRVGNKYYEVSKSEEVVSKEAKL